MTTVGIFTGIAGLGLGHASGVLWEQFHRHRRSERAKRRVDPSPAAPEPALLDPLEASEGSEENRRDPDLPRLKLVSPATVQLPNLVGRRLASVRFLEHTSELDFGGVRLGIAGSFAIRSGAQLWRYPDAGSRDALCGSIGARVTRMRPSGELMELILDSGCELAIPRAGVAVA